MYYELDDNHNLYTFADFKYAENCLYTDIITQEQLDKDRQQVIVEEYEEEVIIDDEPMTVKKYRLALNPDYPAIELEKAKQEKIKENDKARDVALYQGVTYKNVLFDSDTDQKINLMYIESKLGDEQTIVWFGKDNQPLECDKADLINIGGLITQLHTFCWNKNAEIKSAINIAKTIKKVNEIEIDYTITAVD